LYTVYLCTRVQCRIVLFIRADVKRRKCTERALLGSNDVDRIPCRIGPSDIHHHRFCHVCECHLPEKTQQGTSIVPADRSEQQYSLQYTTAGKCDNLLQESDPRHRIWLPCIKDAIDDIAEGDADRSAGRFEFFNGSRY